MYTCNMLNTTEKYAQFLKTAYIFDNLIWLFVISRQKTAVMVMKIHIYCNYFSWTCLSFFFAIFCSFICQSSALWKINSAKLPVLQNWQCRAKNSVCAQNFFAQTWDEPIFVFLTLFHALAHGLQTHDD
jgi:hypothetical protein